MVDTHPLRRNQRQSSDGFCNENDYSTLFDPQIIKKKVELQIKNWTSN